MNRKPLPLFLLLLVAVLPMLAQQNNNAVKPGGTSGKLVNVSPSTKLDLRLAMRLANGDVQNKNMGLLVKGDLEKIKAAVKKWGGVYKFGYGTIASVEIPGKNLVNFTQEQAIAKVENTGGKKAVLMDSARIRNNIDSVHWGSMPLPHAYKGNGVIVGIIDEGIYWQHADFRNPVTGQTRIRYIWDQNANPVNAPAPYAYGNQWSWIDIDNGNCSHVPPASSNGHGTCVAGIAAGNSLSTQGLVIDSIDYDSAFTGVAPEAQIIAVGLKTDDNNFLDHIADGVDYIFKKADAMGLPCVINISEGTYYGSHDGRDLATYVIEDLLDQRKGRVVVAAAGNTGNIPYHLGYDVPADSAFTFFKYNSSSGNVYFDFWADTANFDNAFVTVGCNDVSGADLGRLQYYKVLDDMHAAPGGGPVYTYALQTYDGATALGNVSFQATLDEDRYHVEFLIQPTNTTYLWRLQTTGQGRLDLWSSAAVIGSADMTDYIGTPPVYIQYPSYRHPDSLKTIVSSFQCSDKVITVGNYSNRANYLSLDGTVVDLTVSPYNEIVGHKVANSSVGPTRDGRMKPDVMATGSTTICTGDSFYIVALSHTGSNRLKISRTGYQVRNGGTSMASPIVAGIAALYLQKRPTANYEEVKKILICTATQDSFTGAVANFEYGYGKVNAFKALTNTNCIVFGAMDTACINYNPLANVDSGGCIARVYGCTDSLADNYNPLANTSDGSCTYLGIRNIANDNVALKVVPNPFKGQTTFNLFTFGVVYSRATIKVMNGLGALADEITLRPGQTTYTYTNSHLAAGVYYYILLLDNKQVKAGKLVVE